MSAVGRRSSRSSRSPSARCHRAVLRRRRAGAEPPHARGSCSRSSAPSCPSVRCGRRCGSPARSRRDARARPTWPGSRCRSPLDAPVGRAVRRRSRCSRRSSRRAPRAGVPVDSRIVRGRNVRHALRELHRRGPRRTRIVVAAATNGGHDGFAVDDIAWLLRNAPARSSSCGRIRGSAARTALHLRSTQWHDRRPRDLPRRPAVAGARGLRRHGLGVRGGWRHRLDRPLPADARGARRGRRGASTCTSSPSRSGQGAPAAKLERYGDTLFFVLRPARYVDDDGDGRVRRGPRVRGPAFRHHRPPWRVARPRLRSAARSRRGPDLLRRVPWRSCTRSWTASSTTTCRSSRASRTTSTRSRTRSSSGSASRLHGGSTSSRAR